MLGRCRLAQAAVESLSPVLSWYWWPCRGFVSGTGGLAESLCLWYLWPCRESLSLVLVALPRISVSGTCGLAESLCLWY